MNDYDIKSNAYTYEINMVVQILAKDEKEARHILDEKGGHVSKRAVELLNITELPKERDY